MRRKTKSDEEMKREKKNQYEEKVVEDLVSVAPRVSSMYTKNYHKKKGH